MAGETSPGSTAPASPHEAPKVRTLACPHCGGPLTVRGLLQSSPTAALTLLLGGLAIAGAQPFAVFVSEFAIFKAGLAAGQYWTIGLLAFFVVVAFCGILLQLGRMIFGTPAPGPVAAAAPAACQSLLAGAAAALGN